MLLGIRLRWHARHNCTRLPLLYYPLLQLPGSTNLCQQGRSRPLISSLGSSQVFQQSLSSLSALLLCDMPSTLPLLFPVCMVPDPGLPEAQTVLQLQEPYQIFSCWAKFHRMIPLYKVPFGRKVYMVLNEYGKCL